MATSSDDSSATESFEPTESIFCAIHVTNTKSKVVSFTDKSHQKCRECAAKWISVEDGVECTVAEKFLDHLHRSEGVGPVLAWRKVVKMQLQSTLHREVAGKFHEF